MTTSERRGLSSASNQMLVFDEHKPSYWYRNVGNWIEINATGTPVVPKSEPKAPSKYLAISLPNKDVSSPKIVIAGNRTICLVQKPSTNFHICLKRHHTFEKYNFNRCNSVEFKFVVNASSKILMAYDSTDSRLKRLKCRMFEGISWGTIGAASPNFTSVNVFDFCLKDNSRAFLVWNQPNAATCRFFLSSVNGSSLTQSTYFNYFNPDWETPSNVYAASQMNIDRAAIYNALIRYTCLEQITSGGGYDCNYFYSCDLKKVSSSTSGIELESAFQPNSLADPTSDTRELIPTNTYGVYIHNVLSTNSTTQRVAGSIINTSKVTSSGLVNSSLASSDNLNTPFQLRAFINADIKSNTTLQYADDDDINRIQQVFDTLDNMTFGSENVYDYSTEYTGSNPTSIHGKISKNDRSRALSWAQTEISINSL
ncbi:MAG: hypothetical protein ACI9DJ_000122 [Algoriphagus sp.]|jgi:hypothetical protein